MGVSLKQPGELVTVRGRVRAVIGDVCTAVLEGAHVAWGYVIPADLLGPHHRPEALDDLAFREWRKRLGTYDPWNDEDYMRGFHE